MGAQKSICQLGWACQGHCNEHTQSVPGPSLLHSPSGPPLIVARSPHHHTRDTCIHHTWQFTKMTQRRAKFNSHSQVGRGRGKLFTRPCGRRKLGRQFRALSPQQPLQSNRLYHQLIPLQQQRPQLKICFSSSMKLLNQQVLDEHKSREEMIASMNSREREYAVELVTPLICFLAFKMLRSVGKQRGICEGFG